MTGDNKDLDNLEEAINTLPISSLVIKIDPLHALKIDSCPFCFALYIFPKDILNTKKHGCACGAAFTALGFATKIVKKEVVKI